MAETTAPGRTARRRLARAVTELLAPAVLVAVLLLVMGWHSAHWTAKGLLWGVLASLFASVLPFGYILRRVRTGHVSDHHVRVRAQRRVPLLVGLGSILVGFGLLLALGAARELVAAVVAGAVGLLVSVVVSHWWKMSVHAAVAAGAVVILTLVFGPAMSALWPLVGLVGWSRVELGDHTAGQVVAGAAIGAVVAGAVFSLAR
jgi:membrane-associated phospholipid phosphatase